MSGPASSFGKAWAANVATTAERIVLLSLVHLIEVEGVDCPTRWRMCRTARMSARAVDRAVRRLQEAGLLRVEPRYDDAGAQAANHYSLTLDTSVTAPSAGLAPPPAHWDEWAKRSSMLIVGDIERAKHPRAQLVARIHCLLVDAMRFARSGLPA